MKFNPGDPVWARLVEGPLPAHIASGTPYKGEHPATVVRPNGAHCYKIDCLDLAPIKPYTGWIIHEKNLRPRRDDYQQHEARTTMRDIRDSLRDNLPLRETVDES